MAEPQTVYQRMLAWCQYTGFRPSAMADTPTVVEGKRTITRVPTAEPDKRREGRIANEKFKEMVWKGGSIGEVVDQMSKALGPVDDQCYDVLE